MQFPSWVKPWWGFMKNKNLTKKAMDFSIKVHTGVTRRGNGRLFSSHPISVAMLILENQRILRTLQIDVDEELLATALLHDVLEDTPITFEVLESNFGKNIAQDVQTLTMGEHQSYEDYYKNFKYGSHRATVVKYFDRIDNINDCIESMSNVEPFCQSLCNKTELMLDVFQPFGYYPLHAMLEDKLDELQNTRAFR